MFLSKKTLNINGILIDLNAPKIMGILNVTPDSFFDGGRYVCEKDILNRVENMLQEGADFIDVGGMSTRPGAKSITLEEELGRIVPAIQGILRAFPKALLSIDTFRTEVARQALEEGVVMVNDISGGQLDEEMFTLVAHYNVPYVLTHMRGTPQTMSGLTTYDDLLGEITNYFCKKIDILHQKGVKDILVDPGFGFAKTAEQNFSILKHLTCLQVFDKPLLVGISRKSFIWRTLKTTSEEALNGSAILNTVALLRGANFLRVHDIKEAVEAVKLISFVV